MPLQSELTADSTVENETTTPDKMSSLKKEKKNITSATIKKATTVEKPQAITKPVEGTIISATSKESRE